MSVSVVHGGRFGNHVFQYACARLFAEKNGLELKDCLDGEGILTTTFHTKGRSVDLPVVTFEDGQNDILDKEFPPACYVFRGYFQKAKWYHDRKKDVLRFFLQTRLPAPADPKDIVIHLRLDDYLRDGLSIHPEWYLKVLEMEKFDRLHIVAEEYHEKYFSYFKKFDPVIHVKDKISDWYYVQGFDRIVCANGTFSWWAAFLSRASRIYTHKRWVKAFPHADLSFFPNGVQVDGPFVDEKSL
jgi:hypothetical protein